MVSINDNIVTVSQQVNRLLNGDLPDNRFVTTFVGMLSGKEGTLQYYSAGQAPLLWYQAANGKTDLFRANGIPMGILADLEDSSPQTLSLEEGDIFTLLIHLH